MNIKNIKSGLDKLFDDYCESYEDYIQENENLINDWKTNGHNSPLDKFYIKEFKEEFKYFKKEQDKLINRLRKQLDKYYENLEINDDFEHSYNYRDVIIDTLDWMVEKVTNHNGYVGFLNDESEGEINLATPLLDNVDRFKEELKKEK